MRYRSNAIFLCVLACASASPSLAQAFVLKNDFSAFDIDPATLQIKGALAGAPQVDLAAALATPAALADLQFSTAAAHWKLNINGSVYEVAMALKAASLDIAVTAYQPGEFAWPNGKANATIEAYALPIFGEGRYIPASDKAFAKLLSAKIGGKDLSEVSLPFITQLRGTFSSTWIAPQPADVAMTLKLVEDKLEVGFTQNFTELNLRQPYRVRLTLDQPDPIIGAKQFRAFMRSTGQFRSLDDKIAANADVSKLGGAPHIYFHGSGPLKPEDIKAWGGFVRKLDQKRKQEGSLSARLWQAMSKADKGEMATAFKEAKGKDGFVSKYTRKVAIRAINDALPNAVDVAAVAPLAGGHDPQAQTPWIMQARQELQGEFKGHFKAPETWGYSFSKGLVTALKSAGIDRAWLGMADWRDASWSPEASDLAKKTGYLLGAYDSYASAHPEELVNTWQTAQMGNEIYEGAGYTSDDGSKITGFAGRGHYVNPLALEGYARRRTKAVVEGASLNSLFVDVDATGQVYNDYSKGRKASKAKVLKAFNDRLAYVTDELKVVTGSEGGTWYFAKNIAFSHGMTTPPYAWMDKRIKKDKASKYFRGGYWPPEQSPIFFKATPVPAELSTLMYAPQYKLPLYQVALHDSIVTTHHWEFGSLKAANERQTVALQQILYQIPPLYHLSAGNVKQDLPLMAAYNKLWAPLHKQLFNQPMTAFRFLSEDRMLQQTTFGNGTVITANFGSDARKVGKEETALPAGNYQVKTGESTKVFAVPDMRGK